MNRGDILGSIYEIREQIGQGGEGTIYKAWHSRLGKEVVLKKYITVRHTMRKKRKFSKT